MYFVAVWYYLFRYLFSTADSTSSMSDSFIKQKIKIYFLFLFKKKLFFIFKMSSPGRNTRSSTMTVMPSTPSVPTSEGTDDCQAFQMRPVIRDFKLSAELFASDGDIVLICGRGNQE